MGLSASTAAGGGAANTPSASSHSHLPSSSTPHSNHALDRSGDVLALDGQRGGAAGGLILLDDAESRQLPTRLILSPVGSPDVSPLNGQSGQKYSYSSPSSNTRRPPPSDPHHHHPHHRHASSGVRGGGSAVGGDGGGGEAGLVPVSIRWQAVCSSDRSPSSIPPRSSSDSKQRRSAAPKSVMLVGEWNPSQPIPMHLVSSSADPSGFGDTLVYQCDLSLPVGVHRYYFDVDGRPELAADQPVENSRHVLSVAPSHSASPPQSTTPTQSPTKRVARNLHVEMSRSVPRSVEASAVGKEGVPVSHVRSFTMDASGSTPLQVPLNGTSAPAHHTSVSASVGSVGSRHSAVSPFTPGNFSASPHPSAVAKLFHDKYDPDDEGWGQSIPEFAPAGSPGGSSSPVKSTTATSASNRVVGPPDLPVYLERALLNSGPVADDPSILPLPPRSMLNHVYERNASLELKHMILGMTSRYRDKFVTVVMYKPLPHAHSSTSASTTSTHSTESSYHSVTPPSFSFSDELLGD
eukprot:TRINITY_DN8575_c0_g1_i1.p1 TRINITY_DN8575_c0_g1~~TRINITY_DN8575_c0_g1_i1.p1  ORF type:complete len:521 (-),score=66.56 TRINITY_DN8575_c0_g1_i1:86-1648(-)